MFNVYEIADDFDVFVAFETMNNRGKPFSTLELLKNRLIYLSARIKDFNQLREYINNYWGQIYEMLGKNPNKPLKDDDFLKQHWIMYFEYNRKSENPHKDFWLDKKFTLKNLLQSNDADNTELKRNREEIEKYIKSLAEFAKHYYFMHNLEEKDVNYERNYLDSNEELKNWLKKISCLGFGSFEPLILTILHKRKEYDIGNEKLLETFKEIEKCLFLFLDFLCVKLRLKVLQYITLQGSFIIKR